MNHQDTIIALSTPQGIGALGMIRLSGPKSIQILQSVFQGKNLALTPSHSLHFGKIIEGDALLDEVVVGIYRGPNSYTGQDITEISCHGSPFIIRSILEILIRLGARPAEPGEFTLRAFLNGKMDLSQAEAVADVIASETSAMHQVAMQQLRGGFSNDLQIIRQELLDFASLIELELDFSEEDVEFADRIQVIHLLEQLKNKLEPLIKSFSLGNAIKKGIPVVIAGKPNAGKSTLLNSLIQEDKAIVSKIPGTTRDIIEVELNIEGFLFRLMDTAGLRDSLDEIENIGIKKALQEIERASIVLYIFDPEETKPEEIQQIIPSFKASSSEAKIILVANKTDKISNHEALALQRLYPSSIFISAKDKLNLEILKSRMLELIDRSILNGGVSIITNTRHLNALNKTLEAVEATLLLTKSRNSGELLAFEIKEALYHLGTITGQVSNDELLGNIFGRFCIGK